MNFLFNPPSAHFYRWSPFLFANKWRKADERWVQSKIKLSEHNDVLELPASEEISQANSISMAMAQLNDIRTDYKIKLQRDRNISDDTFWHSIQIIIRILLIQFILNGTCCMVYMHTARICTFRLRMSWRKNAFFPTHNACSVMSECVCVLIVCVLASYGTITTRSIADIEWSRLHFKHLWAHIKY